MRFTIALAAVVLALVSCSSEDTAPANNQSGTDAGPATASYELAYDDGFANGKFAPGVGIGSMAAVRFSPPQGARLTGASFWEEELVRTPFNVHLLAADSNGAPGKELRPAIRVEPSWPEGATNGWLDVDLEQANLHPEGDFFIAMEWLTDPHPEMGPGRMTAQSLGYDTAAPHTRSWMRPANANSWMRVNKVAPENIDLMVHAWVQAPKGELPEPPIVVDHVTRDCVQNGRLGAAVEGYENELVATRLVPPGYPFQVERIRVMPLHFPDKPDYVCDAGLPFRVELYVSDRSVPDSQPDIVEKFTVKIDKPQGQTNVVELEPSRSIVLQQGQALFVAMQLVEKDGKYGCITVCRQPWTPGVTFWSNASAPPYDWIPLESINPPATQADVDLAAIGRVID